MTVTVEALQLSAIVQGRRWLADASHAIDLSIPLRFDGPQPAFFQVPSATAHAIEAGSFIGDVARGGSVNCACYSLTPHCNGTHTECVGHITREPVSVRSVAQDHFVPAVVLSVAPEPASATME